MRALAPRSRPQPSRLRRHSPRWARACFNLPPATQPARLHKQQRPLNCLTPRARLLDINLKLSFRSGTRLAAFRRARARAQLAPGEIPPRRPLTYWAWRSARSRETGARRQQVRSNTGRQQIDCSPRAPLACQGAPLDCFEIGHLVRGAIVASSSPLLRRSLARVASTTRLEVTIGRLRRGRARRSYLRWRASCTAAPLTAHWISSVAQLTAASAATTRTRRMGSSEVRPPVR